MDHSHLKRCHDKQRKAERSIRKSNLVEARQLYLSAGEECRKASEDDTLCDEVRQILSLVQQDCVRKAAHVKYARAAYAPERRSSASHVKDVTTPALQAGPGPTRRDSSAHITGTTMGHPQDSSSAAGDGPAHPYDERDDHGKLYWDMWQVLDRIIKKIPNTPKLVAKAPNNEEESFYIVPPNVHSASEAAYNNDQVAVARQRMAQHYLDKNRQLHQLMATESGIQLNRAYDLDGLVTIQQKCVQSLNTMPPEAQTEVWIKLAIIVSEQVHLLLKENTHLNMKLEEHEKLRKSLINFRRDAEVQQARVKESIMMASSIIPVLPPSFSANKPNVSATASSPVMKKKQMLSELEQLKAENERLKADNAKHELRWSSLREAAMKRKQKPVGETAG